MDGIVNLLACSAVAGERRIFMCSTESHILHLADKLGLHLLRYCTYTNAVTPICESGCKQSYPLLHLVRKDNLSVPTGSSLRTLTAPIVVGINR